MPGLGLKTVLKMTFWSEFPGVSPEGKCLRFLFIWRSTVSAYRVDRQKHNNWH